MGRKKPVKLRSGLTFEGVGEANEYFRTVLNSSDVDDCVAPKDLANAIDLYEGYCAAVLGYEVEGKPINVFCRNNNDERLGGTFAVTKCFYVRFDTEQEVPFSYGKAITAIANQNS
jgi:hypothetical protein